MQDGFLFDELSDFKQNIMRDIQKKFPDETSKFIKSEAKKLSKVAKKIAKREVGTSKDEKKNWQADKSYHKRFKTGKVYKYAENDYCVRAFNSAPHAHLIEYGHIMTDHQGKPTGKFIFGKSIYKQAEIEFMSQWLYDCEDFMTQYVEHTTKGKR